MAYLSSLLFSLEKLEQRKIVITKGNTIVTVRTRIEAINLNENTFLPSSVSSNKFTQEI